MYQKPNKSQIQFTARLLNRLILFEAISFLFIYAINELARS